jgi:hypothetical protein
MSSERAGTWGLVALAVLARAAAVAVLGSPYVPRSTFEHGEIAAHLLRGEGFSVRFLGAKGPTSQQAPVYPVIVAACYAIGGVETPRSLWVLELAQAALGGVLVLGTMALARSVAAGHRGVPFAAGFIVAVHPTLVYAATHVQVALLAATLLVWSLAMGYRAGAATGLRRDAVTAGLLLGLLVLTDPILGLTALGVAWAMAMGEAPGRWARIALTMAVAALVVAPWIARNYRVHGEIVFVKSTFGYAFWQGNGALSEGTDKVARASVDRVLADSVHGEGLAGVNRALWAARHEAGYIDDIALTKRDYEMLGRLSEPERSRVLFRRALADLRDDPMRYPRLCLRRLKWFVLFDETNPKARNLVYRAGHLGLTLAALAGLIVMPGWLRRRLGPTLLVAALITAFHALTIVSARFHVPLGPLLAVWAACGLARLPSGSREGQ